MTGATDITPCLSPFLDLHMMFPLLEYMDKVIGEDPSLISYTSTEIAQVRLNLLGTLIIFLETEEGCLINSFTNVSLCTGPTHMVDYAMDIYKQLHNGEESKEMEEQKKTVYEQLEELRSKAKPLVSFFDDDEKKNALVESGDFNVSGVIKASDGEVSASTVENYRLLAKFNYDCGDYSSARIMLNNYISLFVSGKEDLYDTASFEKSNLSLLEALWGRLSCEILLGNVETATSSLAIVRMVLESLSSSHKISHYETLRQRTWLLHWGLFVFWNGTRKGTELMMDLFTSEKYLQAITTNAPHLIRYLTAAVLINKRRSGVKMMRELMRVMHQSSDCHDIKDPIIEFIDSLCIRFDFEGAQTKLAECENVLKADFFLCKQANVFMEEARVFIFENYCRIHSKLRVSDLAEMLAMDAVSAERWIVDLIRTTDLSAKIDLAENCVVMTGTSNSRASVYQTVLDRTKDLNIRSSNLLRNFQAGLLREKESKEAEYDD